MINLPNRKGVQDAILHTLSQVLTIEQYTKLKANFDTMPDDIFWQIAEECINKVPKNFDAKDMKRIIDEARNINGVTSENCAMNVVPLQVIPTEQANKIWDHIAASHPTDEIKLTREEDLCLINLWENNSKDTTIPSDLFFANTIPLLDCRITVDETKDGGKILRYRIVIFSDYAERIKLAAENTSINIGSIVNDPVNGSYCFTPIYVIKGVDSIMFNGVGYHNISEDQIKKAQESLNMWELSQMGLALLETWYGIQIALLHPTVREVFKKPKTAIDKVGTLSSNSTRKKSRVKYIKVHVINAADLKDVMFGKNKNYSRHSLVWYVIGHWRHLKNGEKIFIKPFWKGALRDSKTAVVERERIIETPSNIE